MVVLREGTLWVPVISFLACSLAMEYTPYVCSPDRFIEALACLEAEKEE